MVFQGNPQAYRIDEDKIAYALSYLTDAAQNWAMLVMQAVDEGRYHDLLMSYDSFQEAMIAVYEALDRKNSVEDNLGKLHQIGSMATYLSMFNKYTVQID